MTAKHTITEADKDVFSYWTPEQMSNALPVDDPEIEAEAARLDDIEIDGPDDDPIVMGPPTPVGDTTVDPWRYVGKLFFERKDGRDASATAVVVGPNQILAAAHSFKDINAKSAMVFAPGLTYRDSDEKAVSPFGVWQVKLEPFLVGVSDAHGGVFNMYLDYAFANVGLVYTPEAGDSSKVQLGSVGTILGEDKIPRIDRNYLPQDVSNGQSIVLTCAGYGAVYSYDDNMTYKKLPYCGYIVRKKGPNGKHKFYKSGAIPSNAYSYQVFSGSVLFGASGGPIMRQDQNGTWNIVGLTSFGNDFMTFSPTFSSSYFQRVYERFFSP